MKFTVDRSKWRCGGHGKYSHGTGSTKLLGFSGMMCCLGHCAIQLGATKKAIRGIGAPWSINDAKTEKRIAGVLLQESGECTKLADDAMDINDNDTITSKQREMRLKALFKKHGHELEFVGEYGEAAQ